MRHKRNLHLYIAVVILLSPSMVFAAWWNPFSWSIWDTWFGDSESEVIDVAVGSGTDNQEVEEKAATSSLDFSMFKTSQNEKRDVESSKRPSDYARAYMDSQSSNQETVNTDKSEGGFFTTGTLGGETQKTTQEQPREVSTPPQQAPKTQNKQAYANLTNEQRAIMMASDLAYPDSTLHVSVRQEINANWDAIMKFYTGKRGKSSVDAMFQDIMEAYIAWKTPSTQHTESKSALSEFTECMEEVNAVTQRRNQERQRCMDDNAGDAIAQYSCPTVNTSLLYSACGVKPSATTYNTITSNQQINTGTLPKSSGNQITIYGQANTYTKVGGTWYGDNGSSFTQVGNTIYANDGRTYEQIGSTVYGSDGSNYVKIGNTTYRNDGTLYTKIGNTVYGSDGTTATQLGNTTYINQ